MYVRVWLNVSGACAMCCALQTEDLARMYRLFQRIPKGLDPVAELFKQHVEGEGNKLVREVSEEIESKRDKEAGKGPTKDAGTPAEQQFVRSVVELHDKYLAFVSTCFNNASLFHKSLKVRGVAALSLYIQWHALVFSQADSLFLAYRLSS